MLVDLAEPVKKLSAVNLHPPCLIDITRLAQTKVCCGELVHFLSETQAVSFKGHTEYQWP